MENLWWNIFVLKSERKRDAQNINNKMNKTEFVLHKLEHRVI